MKKEKIAVEFFEDYQQAFKRAICNMNGGLHLSDKENSPLYAGNYMYMGTTQEGVAAFKNIETREYLRS